MNKFFSPYIRCIPFLRFFLLCFYIFFIYIYMYIYHRIAQVGRDPYGSLNLTPCSLQDYLKLNHMTKSIIQMLLEL